MQSEEAAVVDWYEKLNGVLETAKATYHLTEPIGAWDGDSYVWLWRTVLEEDHLILMEVRLEAKIGVLGEGVEVSIFAIVSNLKCDFLSWKMWAKYEEIDNLSSQDFLHELLLNIGRAWSKVRSTASDFERKYQEYLTQQSSAVAKTLKMIG